MIAGIRESRSGLRPITTASDRMITLIHGVAAGSLSRPGRSDRVLGLKPGRRADIAAETADMVKNQILQQAGISVLAMAGDQAKIALRLLEGI